MILVTGSAGMVGSHLLDAYGEDELYRTDIHPDLTEGIHGLDTRDPDRLFEVVERVKPKRVIHLAAETDVDRCEKEPDHAYTSNFVGTLNVALACQRYDIEMAYMSTAGVFDGAKPSPYDEFDSPGPVNVYARAKLEGEKVVQSLLRRYYIIRAGWMFGGREKDKKFVGKIASLCAAQSEVKVVDDKVGNPTFARDLVRNMKVLTESGVYGLYHMVGAGSCTRLDFAREIARLLGCDTRFVPISSAVFPLPAPRPRSEAARNYKLQLLGMDRMRDWKPALHEYLVETMVPSTLKVTA